MKRGCQTYMDLMIGRENNKKIPIGAGEEFNLLNFSCGIK